MKKIILVLLIPLFLGGCSWSNKIPDTAPPSIEIKEKKVEEIEEVEEVLEEPVKKNEALEYDVVMPSQENETDRLLKEYQQVLDNINNNLK